jgi:hypothetical protein
VAPRPHGLEMAFGVAVACVGKSVSVYVCVYEMFVHVSIFLS